jgi:acetolactate synthase-1/2/3 large subunit
MGYSIPAAIGVKKAIPNKQTVVICGDGSAQMAFNEFATIVSNKLDIKIVLFNNNVLGLVYELQGIEGYTNFGVDLSGSPNFLKLAEAYGIPSKQIKSDDEMAGAVEEMLSHDGPYLLECIISEKEGTKTIYEEI